MISLNHHFHKKNSTDSSEIWMEDVRLIASCWCSQQWYRCEMSVWHYQSSVASATWVIRHSPSMIRAIRRRHWMSSCRIAGGNRGESGNSHLPRFHFPSSSIFHLQRQRDFLSVHISVCGFIHVSLLSTKWSWSNVIRFDIFLFRW